MPPSCHYCGKPTQGVSTRLDPFGKSDAFVAICNGCFYARGQWPVSEELVAARRVVRIARAYVDWYFGGRQPGHDEKLELIDAVAAYDELTGTEGDVWLPPAP